MDLPHIKSAGTSQAGNKHVSRARVHPTASAAGTEWSRSGSRVGEELLRRVCARGGGREVERVSGLEEIKKGFEGGWDGDEEGSEEEEWEL